MKSALCGLVLAACLAACAGAAPADRPAATVTPRPGPATLDPNVIPTEYLPTLAAGSAAPPAATAVVTATAAILGTPEAGTSAMASVTLSPAAWKLWPVTPIVSPKMKAVYEKGLALGNDPHSFSKVGDCQNVATYFLGVYERPGEYRLGPYSGLQTTIDYFKGSFVRVSMSVHGGMNVAAVLSPLWSASPMCNKLENPLACEFRLHRPSIAIVSMETWWSGQPASEYERYLRQVVEYALAQGTVPILATKADNWEGDNSINAAIARVAAEYDVPLWNFWRAVQGLPSNGLTVDGFHLTYARPFFDDPVRMQSAWPVRNLTALQALDAVRLAVAK
jgi:hypothetical protein